VSDFAQIVAEFEKAGGIARATRENLGEVVRGLLKDVTARRRARGVRPGSDPGAAGRQCTARGAAASLAAGKEGTGRGSRDGVAEPAARRGRDGALRSATRNGRGGRDRGTLRIMVMALLACARVVRNADGGGRR